MTFLELFEPVVRILYVVIAGVNIYAIEEHLCSVDQSYQVFLLVLLFMCLAYCYYTCITNYNTRTETVTYSTKSPFFRMMYHGIVLLAGGLMLKNINCSNDKLYELCYYRITQFSIILYGINTVIFLLKFINKFINKCFDGFWKTTVEKITIEERVAIHAITGV